jgi:hypothetical protein
MQKCQNTRLGLGRNNMNVINLCLLAEDGTTILSTIWSAPPITEPGPTQVTDLWMQGLSGR